MTGAFDHPRFILLGLAPLPAYLFFVFRVSRLKAGLATLSGSDSGSLVRPLRRRAGHFAAAWVCLALALAGPRIGTQAVPVRQEGSSVMVVIDISRSMTVGDVLPDRLTYAAHYASLLSSRLANVPFGVTLVKGTGALAVPMTQDRQALRDLLDSLSPSLLSSAGSSLASGIRAAAAAFPETDAASRKILLLTDGDETSGSLMDAAREVGKAGITLVIAGIGTSGGALIDADPDPSPDRVDLRTTVLREDSLRDAAEAAGGKSAYFNASEPGSALRVIDLLGATGARGPELRYSEEPVNRYPEFVLASIFFLVAGLFTGGFAWRKKDGA